jgi:hypothetical protein
MVYQVKVTRNCFDCCPTVLSCMRSEARSCYFTRRWWTGRDHVHHVRSNRSIRCGRCKFQTRMRSCHRLPYTRASCYGAQISTRSAHGLGGHPYGFRETIDHMCVSESRCTAIDVNVWSDFSFFFTPPAADASPATSTRTLGVGVPALACSRNGYGGGVDCGTITTCRWPYHLN